MKNGPEVGTAVATSDGRRLIVGREPWTPEQHLRELANERTER